MAKTNSGDWRNPDRIRAWASDIARALPNARPGIAIEPKARSLGRLLAHGVAGGALCAAVIAGLLQIASTGVAIAFHAIAAPLIFTVIAVRYFGGRGAREPLPTALTFTALVAILDAGIVAALVLRSFTMLTSFAGTWLPLLLIFLITWIIGFMMSTMPWPKAADTPGATSGHKDPGGEAGGLLSP